MKKIKTIGVLGGMGPCASAYFYKLLLTQAQKKYEAVQDSDYPHIIINSLSLEGSDEFGMEENDLILNQLEEGIATLENAGADFIVIACNSVHNIIDKLRKSTKMPIISIIEEVAKEVTINKSHKILLLSSGTTYKYNLYDEALEGIQIIKPESQIQGEVTKLILSVMGSTNGDESKSKIINKTNSMYSSKQIDSVILGCTELPVVIHQQDLEVKLYDSLEILSSIAIDHAYN